MKHEKLVLNFIHYTRQSCHIITGIDVQPVLRKHVVFLLIILEIILLTHLVVCVSLLLLCMLCDARFVSLENFIGTLGRLLVR